MIDPITTAVITGPLSYALISWAEKGDNSPPPEEIPEPISEKYSQEELQQLLRNVDPAQLPDPVDIDDIDTSQDLDVPDFTSRSSTSVDPDGLGFSDVDDSFDQQLKERRHCDSRNNSSSNDDPSFEEMVREWE